MNSKNYKAYVEAKKKSQANHRNNEDSGNNENLQKLPASEEKKLKEEQSVCMHFGCNGSIS